MKILAPFVAVVLLVAIAAIGIGQMGLYTLFGVVIPYLAFATFTLGFTAKILRWAKTPVPFSIQTTCGQQKALDWIPGNELETPHTKLGVVMRMALEVLLFRSLFRNTKATLIEEDKQPKLVYESDKLLWLTGLIFHWSFLLIFVRHYRFFLEPVPAFIGVIESLDGFLEITLPTFFLTDALFLAGVTILFMRRIMDKKVKFMSLAADYFPLFLLMGIAVSGICMRYLDKVDVVLVKNQVQSLMQLSPQAIEIGTIYYIHLFLVSVLAMYFPFSKLMHMGGVFFSPTRNTTNNTRERRHINPWNPDIKIRTYAEYEDDFRAKMKKSGIPVDKEDDV